MVCGRGAFTTVQIIRPLRVAALRSWREGFDLGRLVGGLWFHSFFMALPHGELTCKANRSRVVSRRNSPHLVLHPA